MVIEDIQSIIQSNIDDSSANVDDAIDMAIKFLSNFFNVRKIDTSITVASGDTTIKKPARCLKIILLKIGDNYISKADIEKLQAIENDESQRWHIEDDFLDGVDNNIHLTKAISANDAGSAVKVWYLAGFAPLAGVAGSTTDLPERLEPLLLSFATYFYYGILVSYVKNNKALFPNMTLWDIIALWDTWRAHSFDLLDIIKKEHFK